MRPRTFLNLLVLQALVLIPWAEPCYAGQLHVQYQSLATAPCALLVSVVQFEARAGQLVGLVKKTWGACRHAVVARVEQALWRPVEWDDPGESPIEERQFSATTRRDFSTGESLVLVEDETFDATPGLLRKLDFIHAPATRDATLRAMKPAGLAAWLADFDLGDITRQSLQRTRTLTLDLVLEAHRLAPKGSPAQPIERYRDSLDSKGQLDLLRALCKRAEFRQDADLRRQLRYWVVYQPAFQARVAQLDGWAALVPALDPATHADASDLLEILADLTPADFVSRPGLRDAVNRAWLGVVGAGAVGDRTHEFARYWEALAPVERQALAGDVVTLAMTRAYPSLLSLVLEELVARPEPRTLAALEKTFDLARANPASEWYPDRFIAVLARLVAAHPDLEPALARNLETCRSRSCRLDDSTRTAAERALGIGGR